MVNIVPLMETSLFKIPFVIGVTGHRDLDLSEIGKYKRQIRAVLHYWRKVLPETPISVLTPLAEGADRLVAEVALELRESLSLKVIAPLPFEPAIYEQDFDNGDSLIEFRKLLDCVDKWFALDPHTSPNIDAARIPLPDKDMRSQSNNWGYSPDRVAQYVNVGAFVARSANVLLALWDKGIECGKPGGTGQVVNFMLNGEMAWGDNIDPRPAFESRSLSMGGEHGVVIHVPAERGKSNTNLQQSPELVKIDDQRPKIDIEWKQFTELDGVHWYFTTPLITIDSARIDNSEILDELIKLQSSEFNDALKYIEEFNQDINKHLEKRGRCDGYILPESENDPRASTTYSLFHAADSLANCFQKRAHRFVSIFFMAIGLTILGYELLADATDEITQQGMIALVLFGSGSFFIGFLWLISNKLRYRDRYYRYRSLAETLRINYYLIKSGAFRNLGELLPADSRDRTAWIDQVRRGAEIYAWEHGKEDITQLNIIQSVHEWWIHSQLQYLRDKLNTTKKWFFVPLHQGLIRLVHTFTLTPKIVYAAGFIALLVLCVSYYLSLGYFADYVWVPGAFFALAGALMQWSEIHGYEEDLGRYQIAKSLYLRSSLDIQQCILEENTRRAMDIFARLASSAVDENVKWYTAHTSKDIGVQ